MRKRTPETSLIQTSGGGAHKCWYPSYLGQQHVLSKTRDVTRRVGVQITYRTRTWASQKQIIIIETENGEEQGKQHHAHKTRKGGGENSLSKSQGKLYSDGTCRLEEEPQ